MRGRLIVRRRGRPQVRGSLPYLIAALVLSALLVVTVALAVTGAHIGPSGTSVSDADVDGMDCEADDRRKKEIPDCGRKVNGRYVEWSWVTKGTKPPPGWTPARESAVTSPKPATRTTASTATGGGANLLDGRSRRTTADRNDSGDASKNKKTTRGR